MADINRPPPPAPAVWQKQGGRGGQGGSRKRAFARAVEAYGAHALGAPHDVTSLHGIPDVELTDAVRAALEDLMADLDRLRWRLEQSEGRQAYLEGLADRAALVPVLNRRAFERELGLLLQAPGADAAPVAAVSPEPASAGADPPPVLALFYLTNFETLHAAHGLEAAETALRHVAETVFGALRRSDLVGELGAGAGIAAVLTLMEEAAARAKVEDVRRAILAWPPRHGTLTLDIALAVATVPLAAGLTVAGALALADRALHAVPGTEPQ